MFVKIVTRGVNVGPKKGAKGTFHASVTTSGPVPYRLFPWLSTHAPLAGCPSTPPAALVTPPSSTTFSSKTTARPLRLVPERPRQDQVAHVLRHRHDLHGLKIAS